MDFDAKAYNIILIIFHMKINFQDINAHLNEKLV
jgi:hypothetical protein